MIRVGGRNSFGPRRYQPLPQSSTRACKIGENGKRTEEIAGPAEDVEGDGPAVPDVRRHADGRHCRRVDSEIGIEGYGEEGIRGRSLGAYRKKFA